MPKITKRVINSLRPTPGHDLFVWDNELRGFGVRIKPSGRGAYIVQYRTREGRTRRYAFARVGASTPEQARALARDKLHEVSQSKDPSLERHKLRHALTVAELCDLYLRETEAEGRVKASTLSMDKSRINAHVKPLIGRRSVATLTTEDISELGADIVAGKSAREPNRDNHGNRTGRGGVTKGGRGVAARTIGMLGTILEFGRKRRLLRENPARGVARPPHEKRKRFLSIGEIANLGKALRTMATEGENPVALAAIRLLAITGFRKMEAMALPRRWVDARLRCVRFEDSKSGAQIRPLGTSAVSLIKEQIEQVTDRARRGASMGAGSALPVEDSSPWVFSSTQNDGHIVGLPKVLKRACERAGLTGVTLHTLRHTFAAIAAELGFSELTIAGLLGHSVPGITARYAHVPDSALVAAADRVSVRIANLLDGVAPTRAEVIQIPVRT